MILPINDDKPLSYPELSEHLISKKYDSNELVLVKTVPNHARYFNMIWANNSRYWHLRLIEHKKYNYIIIDFYNKNINGDFTK